MCFPSRQNVGVGKSEIHHFLLTSASLHHLSIFAPRNTQPAKNYTSAGTVGVLLTGSCLSVPAGESIDHIVEKLRKETPKSKSESARVKPQTPQPHKPGLVSAISR